MQKIDYLKKVRNIEKKLSPKLFGMRLYAKDKKTNHILVMLPYLTLGYSSLFLTSQIEKYFNLHGLTYNLVGAGSYIAGMLADHISTIKALNADSIFYKKYYFHKVYEGNPILPAYPTVKDLFGFSKKGVWRGFAEYASLSFSFVAPLFGFAVLPMRSFACLNNMLMNKKIKLEDKLLGGVPKPDQQDKRQVVTTTQK